MLAAQHVASKRITGIALASVLGMSLVLSATPARAQGLIWSLPEDGSWIRYEGPYRQVQFRPESAGGDLTLDWFQHLTIKSVGQEQAEFRGEEVPCRWLEFIAVTGTAGGGGIDPGPAGRRVYKVLVPESGIIGKVNNDRNIHVSYLPIVRGYRKLGDEAPEELKSDVFDAYPVVSLLRHYRQLESASERAEDAGVGVGPIRSMRFQAQETLESRTTRTVHEATLWKSDEIPFGLARWTLKISREAKPENVPRSGFQPVSQITVEMKAQEIGRGARSELSVR